MANRNVKLGRRAPEPLALRFLSVCLLWACVTGCEYADVGNLAVTWRFNDTPLTQGFRPCEVMFAETSPAPPGLIRIELTGPKDFVDYVACEAKEGQYPLHFYHGIADGPPDVYARLLSDVPAGTYNLRVSFIDRHDQEVEDPPPVEQTVKVKRDRTIRVDLDFPLTYGRVDVRWSIGDGLADCADAGATGATVRLIGQDTSYDRTVEFLCDDRSTDATPFTPVPPGNYRVEAQLLDNAGQPVTVAKQSTMDTLVEAARTADTISVTFDATDLI